MDSAFYPLPCQEEKGDLQEILRHHRDEAQKREEETLYKKAALSKDHQRLEGVEQDHRLPYKRDVDRIVHSRAYARYIDKTQVVYLVDNDHITHRVLHVQLVSNFGRGVAEILGLNCDLVEAIALGHDAGHCPFGHEGEEYLSKLSMEYAGTPFVHPHQSCRLFREIEPLNLGLNVYDGFLCHDGGSKDRVYKPKFGKTVEEHKQELDQKLADPDKNIPPATLEGCLVKIADTVSYLGRDIEDAIRLGIIQREDVPQTMLGTYNREILSRISADIISNSYQQPHIAISQEVFDALWVLRRFNFEKIYSYAELKVESEKIERSYRILFETLLEDYERNSHKSHLWTDFLHNKSERYLSDSTDVQMTIDYLAGMTDKYFVKTLERIVVPQQITL